MIALLKSLPLTFYSRPFYFDLVRQGQGIGMGFILLLTLLGTLAFAAQSHKSFQMFAQDFQALAEGMPELTMKDGKLSVDAPMPYTIDLSKAFQDLDASMSHESGAETLPSLLRIDTTYQIQSMDALLKEMTSENIVALVTADKVVTRRTGRDAVEIRDIGKYPNGTFTHEKWLALGESVSRWVFPFVTVVMASGLFVVNFVAAFFVALVALVISPLFKISTSLSAMMRLATAIALPVGVVAMAMPLSGAARVLLWAGYIGFALWSARGRSAEA